MVCFYMGCGTLLQTLLMAVSFFLAFFFFHLALLYLYICFSAIRLQLTARAPSIIFSGEGWGGLSPKVIFLHNQEILKNETEQGGGGGGEGYPGTRKELRISHVQVMCNLVTAELLFSFFVFLSFQVCHMVVYTEFVEMSLQFRSCE